MNRIKGIAEENPKATGHDLLTFLILGSITAEASAQKNLHKVIEDIKQKVLGLGLGVPISEALLLLEDKGEVNH